MGIEPSPAVDPCRLQELQEVTREYGSYGRTRFGLGSAAMGAWMILAALVHPVAPGWGRLLLWLAAPLWFGVLVLVRRGYQRRGAVTPIEVVRDGLWIKRWSSPRVQGIVNLVGWGVVPCAFMLSRSTASLDAALLPPGVGFALIIACIVTTAFFTWLVGRGFQDTVVPGTMIYLAWMLGSGREGGAGMRPGEFALLLGLSGVAFAVKGVYEHRRYARLERRLAALRNER